MEDGVVCPAILPKNDYLQRLRLTSITIFSATTATASFHVTRRSVFHHPVSSPPSNSQTFEFKGQNQRQKLSAVSQKRTQYKTSILEIKNKSAYFTDTYLTRNLLFECKWLQFVSLTNEVLDDETVSLSAYHSSNGRVPHQHFIIAAGISRTNSFSSHNG